MTSEESNGQASIVAVAKSRWRAAGFTTGGAAFLLSLTLAVVTLWQSMRGPEIDVLSPSRVLVYRDKDSKILYVGLKLTVVNRVKDYNDVLVDASIKPTSDAPNLPYIGPLKVVFNDVPDENGVKAFCVPGLRCHPYPKMAISELPDEAFVAPAAQATSVYMGFRLHCSAALPDCKSYREFTESLAKLSKGNTTLKVTLNWYGDGSRVVSCEVDAINSRRITKTGWQTLLCRNPSVSGGSFL